MIEDGITTDQGDTYPRIRRDMKQFLRKWENRNRKVPPTLPQKELDQDDEELTATQKVKRKVIETRFEKEIEGMYR